MIQMLGKVAPEKSTKEFSSCRKFGGPATDMVASLGFKKQLWALDKCLDVVWNFIIEKWEVWKFPGQEEKKVKLWNDQAFHVTTIQTKKKEFRDLGADILLKLQAGDTRKFSLEQLVQYFNQMEKNLVREKNKRLYENIHARNLDLAHYSLTISQPVPKEYLFQTPNSLSVQRAIAGGL